MDSNPKRPLLQRPFSNHINMRYKWWWTLQGSFRTSLCLEEVHVRSAGPNRAASQPPRSCLPGAWKGMEETLTVTRRGDPPRTRSDPGSSYPASRLTARTGPPSKFHTGRDAFAACGHFGCSPLAYWNISSTFSNARGSAFHDPNGDRSRASETTRCRSRSRDALSRAIAARAQPRVPFTVVLHPPAHC